MKAGIFFTMAGSWAVALKRLGIDIAWHFCVPEFHEVFKLNFPEVGVSHRWEDIYGEVDIVVGSPPCIGMSSANPGAKEGHAANAITLHFATVVNFLKPKGFIMEMVPMIARPKFEVLFHNYKERLKKNYNFKWEIIEFADYGVPHSRKRFIIIGIRKDLDREIIFPLPLCKRTLISKAFRGLPKLTEEEAVEQKLTRKFNPKWKGPFSMYIKKPNHFQLKWDKISPCVTAIGTQYFKHPDFLEEDKRYHRLITYKEAARLMTFPDRFKFTGGYSKKIKQIAWGVPPRGIQRFIRKLMELLG